MRRPVKNRIQPQPDTQYGSVKVHKLVNYIMADGKKDLARRIVYRAFEELKKDGDPIAIFEDALKKAEPLVEVRSRRVGGANYQVPCEVRPERRLALALRWIVGAAKAKRKTGKPMELRLAEELRLAARGEGEAVTKKENIHKMAEANKAFAHFAW